MEERLQNIKNEALAQIMSAETEIETETLRVTYLGRKGELNKIIQKIGELPKEKRGGVGRIANDVKEVIERAIQERRQEILARGKKGEWFDPTVPGKKPERGHLHLITQAVDEISQIFEKMGFIRIRTPEVDWDWYAFEALNIPKGHPARDEWETFFVDAPPHPKLGEMILTPHTSSGQIRDIQRVKKPPVRTIIIGKCYRRQSDVSHAPMFHQCEGLVVDKGISLVHLKGTLEHFIKRFFGKERKFRLRPFHFNFTEPSFEFDISCGVCNGKGCKLCKAGWLELGGAGIVHPSVLKNGRIDPKIYTGFAFGLGVERTFMMKEGLKIDDIRLLHSGDLRFLRQF